MLSESENAMLHINAAVKGVCGHHRQYYRTTKEGAPQALPCATPGCKDSKPGDRYSIAKLKTPDLTHQFWMPYQSTGTSTGGLILNPGTTTTTSGNIITTTVSGTMSVGAPYPSVQVEEIRLSRDQVTMDGKDVFWLWRQNVLEKAEDLVLCPPLNQSRYDKSKWGRGPWDNEPDYEAFEVGGFQAVVRRNTLGNLCGYLGLPPDHPWWTAETYDDVPCGEAHGGLTFMDTNKPMPMMVDQTAPTADGRLWIGFDCGHSGDLTPLIARTSDILNQGAVYRDFAYVKDVLARMAKEAADAVP